MQVNGVFETGGVTAAEGAGVRITIYDRGVRVFRAESALDQGHGRRGNVCGAHEKIGVAVAASALWVEEPSERRALKQN